MSRKHPTCAIHHFSREQAISIYEAIWLKNFWPESICPSCMIGLERIISHEEIARELQKQADAYQKAANLFSNRVSGMRSQNKSKKRPAKG